MLRILEALKNAFLAMAVHLRIYFKFLSIIPVKQSLNTNQKVLTKYQNPPARIDEKYQTFCGT